MKITVWGARGSIPVSGPEYVRYGGDTTCLQIETDAGETVVLDAGTGLRRLGIQLAATATPQCSFLLTHAHWDHLMGFPFFRPLYQAGATLHIYGCRYAQDSIRTILRETMRPPFFPVDLSEIAATLTFHEDNAESFHMAGLSVDRIPLNHPNRGCGFIVREGTRRLAFLPDNELGKHHEGGLSQARYAELLRGVDLLIHDGEYLQDEYDTYARGWGHSCCLATADLAAAARVGKLLLWHLNQERTDEQADALLAETRTRLESRGEDLPCELARTGLVLSL